MSDFWNEYMAAVASGESRKDFAKRMGTTANAVYSRVYDKRKQGYDLPHLPPGPPVERRNAFADLMEKHGIVKSSKPLDCRSPKPRKTRKKAKVQTPQPQPQPVEESHDGNGECPDEILDILGDIG